MARRSRSRKSGKKRSRKKDSGLFKPPKHKWIADIVTFESPGRAERAAERLVNAIRRGRIGRRRVGRKTALTILRSLNYAANRAAASARRRNLSPMERSELLRISDIYREAAEEASEIYHSKYK